VNFYRILREEDGLPVAHRSGQKVKSETPIQEEKVKFPTLPKPENVKSDSPMSLELLKKVPDKVVETKEREKKGAPLAPFSLSPTDLKRLGLTPGSIVWNSLVGEDKKPCP
jgi:hypothetical protein